MTTPKSTKPSTPMYLLLTEERKDGYFHLRGRLVTQKYEHSQWTPYGVDDDYSDGLLWSGLAVSCQGDAQSRTRTDGREVVYGFETEYRDLWSVDLRKARRMLKTLDQLQKKLDKIGEARGYVKSFGEYCGRVAEAFGCAGIGIARNPQARYNPDGWDWLTLGDGINRINHAISRWADEGRAAEGGQAEVAS